MSPSQVSCHSVTTTMEEKTQMVAHVKSGWWVLASLYIQSFHSKLNSNLEILHTASESAFTLSVFLLTLYLVILKRKNSTISLKSFILSPAVHFSKIIFLGNNFSKDWKPSFKLNSKYSSLIKFEFLWVASNSVGLLSFNSAKKT